VPAWSALLVVRAHSARRPFRENHPRPRGASSPRSARSRRNAHHAGPVEVRGFSTGPGVGEHVLLDLADLENLPRRGAGGLADGRLANGRVRPVAADSRHLALVLVMAWETLRAMTRCSSKESSGRPTQRKRMCSPRGLDGGVEVGQVGGWNSTRPWAKLRRRWGGCARRRAWRRAGEQLADQFASVEPEAPQDRRLPEEAPRPSPRPPLARGQTLPQGPIFANLSIHHKLRTNTEDASMSTPTKSPAARRVTPLPPVPTPPLQGSGNGGQYKHLQVLEGPWGPPHGQGEGVRGGPVLLFQ